MSKTKTSLAPFADLDLWDICELIGMMYAMLRADKYIFGESVHTFKIIKENKT